MDYTQPELDLLLDLLKDSNSGLTIRQDEVVWDLPIPVDPQSFDGRDTSIEATVVNSDRYRGSATFYYRRVPMRRLIAPCLPVPRIQIGRGRLLSENLTWINQALNLSLEVGSIVDLDLDQLLVNYDVWTPIQIVANPNSRVYVGSMTIYLMRNAGLV